MEPESYLTIELEPHEAHAETLKNVMLPWSGQTVTVRVAAGTVDGSVLRLAGLGPAAADGSPQDAYVRLHVKSGPAPYAPPPPYGPPGAPGQPPYAPPPLAPPPLAPPSPAGRRRTLVGVAVAVVALLVCCGLPLAYFASRDDGETRPAAGVDGATPPATPSPSAVPISADQYQTLLAETDRTLAAGFGTLAAAKNPKAVRSAASGLTTMVDNQRRALEEVVPPPAVATAHDSLVDGLASLTADLAETGSDAASGGVCLGPAAVARVGRETAAGQLRTAAQALATADSTRAYQVGSFVPKATKDGNRRLGNGTYIKRTQGGSGQLKIENGGADSVISVVRSGSKSPVIRVYVRAKGKFTVRGVRDGTYQVFMTSGKDWDARLKAFSRDCGFSKFDDSFKFTTTSRTYTGWTITLTPVTGGNASTSGVDPEEFPGG